MKNNMNHAGHKTHEPSRKIAAVLFLTVSYMIAEAVGGFLSNSLALIADAGHMLADVAALSISLFAFYIAARPPDNTATFGYYRAEIIGALFNGVILFLVSFFIVKEAVMRVFVPATVDAKLMMPIALGGLAINIFALFILHKDKESNLNIRGAWLHVFSDTLGSVCVVISGLFIYLFNWHWVDPMVSILIAVLVSRVAIKLILQTLRVLMEHTPEHIDPKKVSEEILRIPLALKVHDLHVWTIASGREALCAHVVAKESADQDLLLFEIHQVLRKKFAIGHSTIQIEKNCQTEDQVC